MKRNVSILVHHGRLARWDLELRGNGDVGRKSLQSVSLQDLYAFEVASLRGRGEGGGVSGGEG